MKKLLASLLAVALIGAAAPVSFAEPHQVMQGTQIHLTLLNSIGTSASRDGDPFVAVVAEPVYLGSQLLIPTGTRVNGIVGTVATPRRFSIFRGEAYMSLTFRSLEADSRLIPVHMSILSIEQPGEAEKLRKDMKVEEGGVIQEKHDYKGDVMAATIGTGGGTLVGAVFSHVARGFGIGLAGSAAYIMSRKGKDVVIPAHSGILVRMDNSIVMPAIAADHATPSATPVAADAANVSPMVANTTPFAATPFARSVAGRAPSAHAPVTAPGTVLPSANGADNQQ
jgi:hypothetical protein